MNRLALVDYGPLRLHATERKGARGLTLPIRKGYSSGSFGARQTGGHDCLPHGILP